MSTLAKLTYKGQDFDIHLSNAKDPKDAESENIQFNFPEDIQRIIELQESGQDWLEKQNITSSTELVMHLIPEFERIYNSHCRDALSKAFAERAVYYEMIRKKQLLWTASHIVPIHRVGDEVTAENHDGFPQYCKICQTRLD